MSLRHKTLLLTCGLITLFFVVLYESVQHVVLHGFENIERDQANRDLLLVSDAVQNEQESLRRLISHWAIWDDSYSFIEDGNTSFTKANLLSQSFRSLNLNLIAFVKNGGRITYAALYSESDSSLQELNTGLLEELSRFRLLDRALSDTIQSGIITLHGRPILVAAHAILTSQAEGPARGVLVLGRYLDTDDINLLSETTHIAAMVFGYKDPTPPHDVLQAKERLTPTSPRFYHIYDEHTAAGYALIKDMDGDPALILRITLPREITGQALRTIRVFFYMILGISLLFAALIVLALEKSILARMANLNASITAIAAGGNVAARVPVQGRDEIASLATQINEMLATTAKSQADLRHNAENLQRLNEELRIHEEKLRSIFDSSPVGIWISDLEGVVLECNQASLAMQGFADKQRIIGRNLIELMAPKERARGSELWKQVAQGRSLARLETHLVRDDGSLFPAELSLGLAQGPGGQPAFMVIIAQDVAERKRAEQAITTSEQRYRVLFERNSAGVFRSTLDGRLLDVNESLIKMFGFESKKAMIAHHVLDFYCRPAERENFLNALWSNGTVSNLSRELRRIDGSRIWILVSASLIIGEMEEPVIIQGTVIDITDMKKAEDELRASEARYRLLMERNPAGVFRFAFDPRSKKLRRLDCNDAHAQILGYSSKEELMGVDPAQTFVSADDYEERIGTLLSQGSVNNYQACVRRKDGSQAWVLVNASLIPGENGSPPVIEGSLIDVSELKNTHERERVEEIKLLEQSQQASLGLLAAGLAHNLNGPLQGIVNSVEILQLMHGDLPHLDEILQQALRLNAMINNTLVKTRQDQDPGEQEIDLNRLLIQELDFYGCNLVFKHEIEKRYNFDSSLPTIRGVYCDFSQAFMNIIKNAVDAMHGRDQKLLCVTTKTEPDGSISVEFEDTGSGIAAEHLKRIFDPFFTTKPLAGHQQDDEPTGTGLGLSSAQQILEKYQARFEVQSQIGLGTTLRINFPGSEPITATTEAYSAMNRPEASPQN